MTDGARPRPSRPWRPTPGVLASLLLCVLPVDLAPTSSMAQQIHRRLDAQGNVHYSNSPQPSAGETEAPAALPAPVLRPGFEPVRATPVSPDEMLELSGLRTQLPALAREAVTHLDGGPVDLEEPARSTMRRLAQRAFDPTRVYPLVRDAYARHSVPENRAAAAAWLRSPAGRRMVARLREDAPPDAVVLSAFAAAQRPPTPGRLELIERLDWVSGWSEASVDLVVAVQRGLALGLTRFLPPEQRPRPGELATEAQERRAEVLRRVREPLRVRLMYALRDIADEDVREYIEFESSPAARAHTRALQRALTHALALAAERTGIELARSRARPGTAIAPAR